MAIFGIINFEPLF